MKFRSMVADRIIPSTMLAGYTLPTMAQAGIFLVLLGVSVEPWLLLCSILTFIPGALVGASWQRRPRFASSKVVRRPISTSGWWSACQ